MRLFINPMTTIETVKHEPESFAKDAEMIQFIATNQSPCLISQLGVNAEVRLSFSCYDGQVTGTAALDLSTEGNPWHITVPLVLAPEDKEKIADHFKKSRGIVPLHNATYEQKVRALRSMNHPEYVRLFGKA